MKEIDPFCESCRQVQAEVTLEQNDVQWPYRICAPCAHRLTTYSLRPLEWFRLASKHGPNQYYLHDDFYSQQGEALLSKDDISPVEYEPAPTLSQAALDLDTLIDYTITRFILDKKDPLLDEFKRYPPSSILAKMQQLLHTHPPIDIETRVYEICAYALGSQAASLIRKCWEIYRSDVFFALALASAFCLPLQEGLERVTTALDTLPSGQMRIAALVLAHFHTTMTLDWLENHVTSPVTASWGRLAALSQFSWTRAVKWFDYGRPLSLVALDALRACVHYDTPQLREYAPRLLNQPAKEEQRRVLEAYLSRDPSPRVKQVVAFLSQI